jgi:hypothetical protein
MPDALVLLVGAILAARNGIKFSPENGYYPMVLF